METFNLFKMGTLSWVSIFPCQKNIPNITYTSNSWSNWLQWIQSWEEPEQLWINKFSIPQHNKTRSCWPCTLSHLWRLSCPSFLLFGVFCVLDYPPCFSSFVSLPSTRYSGLHDTLDGQRRSDYDTWNHSARLVLEIENVKPRIAWGRILTLPGSSIGKGNMKPSLSAWNSELKPKTDGK